MIQLPEVYQGKQVIITSDRLVFNAREDSIFSSDSTIAFATNKDFHINTGDTTEGKFVVNSPKIHLGEISNIGDIDPTLANNPAVKGKELETLLIDILDHLNTLYTVVLPTIHQISTLESSPTVPSPANAGLISPLISDLEVLRGKINSIKSKNVYIQ